MIRPLFEEPSPAIERSSPWAGPKGFLIGGMALPIKEELSLQYFDAANLLLKAIHNDEMEDYRLVNPVLFLYRHSIELMLKSFVDSTGHDLAALADKFAAVVKQRFGEEPPAWIMVRLKEIAQIDPNSTAFRYSENYNRQLKQHVPVDGELYISLSHLREVMETLNAGLVSVWRSRTS
jgi:hypothetical protein